MDGIIYLTLEQAEHIHRKTITYSGGGIYEPLDVGKLDSVLQHIQNDLYYPTFVDKLTHLFFCTCEFHCFADGNKRLAITLSLRRWTKGYTIKQPNMDCQPTEITALMRHRAVFS